MAIGTNGINYILTGDNQWIKYNSSTSSGGGGGIGEITDIEPISSHEIDSLFT